MWLEICKIFVKGLGIRGGKEKYVGGRIER